MKSDTMIRAQVLAALAMLPTAAHASMGGETVKLLPTGGVAVGGFGAAVAIQGNLVVARTPGDDQAGVNAGSIHLFDAATGDPTGVLVAGAPTAWDRFGVAVAIAGGIAVVGAPFDISAGCALHVIDARSRSELHELAPVQASADSRLGASVGTSGPLAIAGAPFDWDAGARVGAAYVFDTGTGALLARLVASDAATLDRFGWAVAISGATAIVGSPWDDDNGFSSGSVYVFDAPSGELLAKLVPSDNGPGDYFGVSVAMTGALAVVGASGGNDNGAIAGSAYVFDLTQALATPYCFGSGGAPCPCSNSGAPGSGCANSAHPEGARLRFSGSPCVGADDFVLRVTRSRPSQLGVFFQGEESLGGGLGIPFGDGLRCAGDGRHGRQRVLLDHAVDDRRARSG